MRLANKEAQRNLLDRDVALGTLNYNTSFLTTVLNSTADGIITLNPAGIIQSFNHTAEVIFGLKISTASDGKQALNVLENVRVDVVLSDWRMPNLNGLELCKIIGDKDKYGQPYFIMLTGQKQRADFIAAMDAGADDFIAKPAWGEELRVRLQAALRLRCPQNLSELR